MELLNLLELSNTIERIRFLYGLFGKGSVLGWINCLLRLRYYFVKIEEDNSGVA